MNSPLIATRAVILAGMLSGSAAGCSNPEPPDAMRVCDGERASMAISDPTPLGPTGAALVQGFASPMDGTLQWSDGGSTGLVLAIRPDPDTDGGAVEYFTPADEADPHCTRHLAIPVVVELTTPQGELQETWRDRLQVFEQDRATLRASKPADLLQGSADLSRYIPSAAWDEANAQLLLNLEFKAAGRTGVLLLESHSEVSGSKAEAEFARF